MKRLLVILSVPLVLSLTHPALCDTTSPGVNSVGVSGAVTIGTTPTVVLSGEIKKGKRRRLLQVVATVFPTVLLGAGTVYPRIQAKVNGVDMPFSYQHTCGTQYCTVNGTWWIDLDGAEAASPGMFLGQPLTVELEATNLSSVGIGADATMTASMLKK